MKQEMTVKFTSFTVLCYIQHKKTLSKSQIFTSSEIFKVVKFLKAILFPDTCSRILRNSQIRMLKSGPGNVTCRHQLSIHLFVSHEHHT